MKLFLGHVRWDIYLGIEAKEINIIRWNEGDRIRSAATF